MSSASPAPGAPQSAAKAAVAAVVAAVGTALAAYFTGTDAITVRGLLAAVVAGAVAGVTTYLTPNKPKGEAGVVDVVLLFVVATFVLAVLIFCGVHLHTH
jgi:drug/metabolite transporter (DMT)-like permease